MTVPRVDGRTTAVLAVTLLLAGPAQGQDVLGVDRASSPKPERAAAGRPPCCYTNPQYAGPCAVQPGKGETCASILSYLNDPRSQGKSYCNNTNIRGGWKRVRCVRARQANGKD